MARTLPEGDPRYATDFLPRTDGAGCSPGGGGASGSWWPWPRLCQELRTQELAGVLWPTWRRFDPSSSPSATLAEATYSPRQFSGQFKPNNGSDFSFELRTPSRQGVPHCSPKGAFISEALYSAASVRFSKFQRFEEPTNFNEKRFCGSSRAGESIRGQFAMSRSESFRPSQPFPRTENVAVVEQKSPPLAGFCYCPFVSLCRFRICQRRVG
jgi:hypothetical protein